MPFLPLLMFHRYSLWVAAAVNMKTISVSDLSPFDGDSAYEAGDRDDTVDDDYDDDTGDDASSTRRRNLLSAHREGWTSTTSRGPKRVAKTRVQLEERSEKSRKLNMHSGAWADRGKSFTYSHNLEPMVFRKFDEKMDPVWCTPQNETKGSYCWLSFQTGNDDASDDFGAYFFPLIQHYDADCLKCQKFSTSTAQKAFDQGCNTIDLDYLLLFNAYAPSKPHYANYNVSNHYHYDILNEARKGLTYSGFTGYINVNLFNVGYNSEHAYLNDLHYKMPNTQCTTPIAIASTQTKNAQACGSSYSIRMIEESRKNTRGKYCFMPPEAPLFKCSPFGWTCFNRGLAHAWSFMGFLNMFFITGIIVVLNWCVQ